MRSKKILLICVLIGISLNESFVQAGEISFVAIADNRSYADQFRILLQELNEPTVNPEPVFPYPDFLVACGDFDPVAPNMGVYSDTATYPNLPPFYPVVGNHEFETPSDMSYILKSMIPHLANVVNHGTQGTYSFDWGPLHCIALDQYTVNVEGEVDDDLLAWLQADLNATDKDHIFVFGHEPAFPRYRHTGDALNLFRRTRDAFWNMLVTDPRVRAYFCGHTHNYYRMQVLDPADGASGFPDQEGGLYQVDCGAAGHVESDGRLTLVYVHIEEEQIRFRAVTSPRDSADWVVTDEWTIQGMKRMEMELIEPGPGGEVSGSSQVMWTVAGDAGLSSSTVLYVSRDAGARWDTLGTAGPGVESYSWDTVPYPDGTRYLLRIVIKGTDGFGMVQSAGTFTVNNPGNGAPDVVLISPGKGDVLSGLVNVEWQAADADRDPLSVTLEVSIDEGITWLPLAADQPDVGTFIWETEGMPNSTHYMLKVNCFDGTVWSEAVSGTFPLWNEREVISDLAIDHIEGIGSGSVSAHIIDEGALTDHWYRIMFDDTTAEKTTCTILDLDAGTAVVEDAAEMDGLTEGPLFDGLRLQIRNYATPVVDLDGTGWTSGASDIEFVVSLPEIDLGTEMLRGTPYPADYEIRISDHVVDTSGSFYGTPALPMQFTVWNVTEGHRTDIIYLDFDANSALSRLDEVYLFEADEGGEPMMTWLLFFTGRENCIPPKAEDIFTLSIFKPFTQEDVFEFTPASRGLKGDVNGDHSWDVLDLVIVIRHCLQIDILSGWSFWRADCNSDGQVDILDVTGSVNMIIGRGDCTP